MSNQALLLRQKVFGEDNLHFYDENSPELGFLPIDPAQVMLSNDRIDAIDVIDPERPDPQGHFGVHVDLDAVDMTGWERAEVIKLYDSKLKTNS